MTSVVRYDRPVAVVDEHVRARSWVELMGPAVELAKAIAATEFVPRAMRHNAAAISAAILYGDEVGLGPMQSLAKIVVIDGRPTLYAEAQRALVFAAGHELWLDELTSSRATWAGKRAGTDTVTRVTWSLDDARRAGLAGREAWRKYPRQMLSARASAELVRAMFADVVGGLAAVEEFETETEGAVGSRDSVAGESGTRRRRRRPGAGVAAVPSPAAVDTAPAAGLPPLPGESSPDVDLERPESETEPAPITRAQMRRLHGLMGRRGITERDDRLAYASRVLARHVPSSKDLSTVEADALIDDLEASLEAPAGDDDEAVDGELVDEQNREAVAGDTDREGAP